MTHHDNNKSMDTRPRLRNLFTGNNLDYHTLCSVQTGKAMAGGALIGTSYGMLQNFWYAYTGAASIRHMLGQSVFGAYYSGLYFGSVCLMTKLRDTDDVCNAVVGGFLVGLSHGIRRQKPVKMFAYSTFSAAVALIADITRRELENTKDVPFPERHWSNWNTFVVNDRPDPFKRRMEELKARGLPGAQSQDK